jgi:uncharacterized protein (DUF302 family)
MHYLSKSVTASFEDAVDATKEALRRRNLAILAEIDVDHVLRTNLGIGFRPYVILCACSLPLARQAIEADSDIGSILLCNVVVQQHRDGRVEISVADPTATVGTINHVELIWIARRLRSLVRDAIADAGALTRFQRAAAKGRLRLARALALA